MLTIDANIDTPLGIFPKDLERYFMGVLINR